MVRRTTLLGLMFVAAALTAGCGAAAQEGNEERKKNGEASKEGLPAVDLC